MKTLLPYLNYEFSTGCTTGEDYKTFERKYIKYLKLIAKENGWEIVNIGKSHYEFSAFFKNKDKYVYISISDVRFFQNDWYNHILFRIAKHEKDYTGGGNQYTTLTKLPLMIEKYLRSEN